MEMKIEEVGIDTLILDPANARRHGDRNVEAIKGSLKRFNQQKPIVVGPDNVVVAGNGTLIAARQLGWKTVKIVRTDLKGSQLTAFGIADNRTAELAEWDNDNLMSLIKSLNDEDPTLALATGFDMPQIEAMLKAEALEFPDIANGKDVDEEIAKDVKMATCPNCEHRFPL